MSVYDFKPRFQALLRPTANALQCRGVTPNAVTIAAIVGSIAVGWASIYAWAIPWLLLLLPGWLFLRMALNAIDGMLAREHDMKTPLGAVLNEAGDVVSDAALYLPLAFFTLGGEWPVVAFVLGAVLTEFCGLLGQALGASRRYDGPMGKSDRALLVGALATATFAFPRLYAAWPAVFGIGAALALVTSVRRCRAALAELASKRGALIEALRSLDPLWRMGALVGILLVFASLVLLVLSLVRPGEYLGELWARTRSWWIMASVFFAAAAAGPWVSLALFAFMSFWAMKEFMTLLQTRTADHARARPGLSRDPGAVPLGRAWPGTGCSSSSSPSTCS